MEQFEFLSTMILFYFLTTNAHIIELLFYHIPHYFTNRVLPSYCHTITLPLPLHYNTLVTLIIRAQPSALALLCGGYNPRL